MSKNQLVSISEFSRLTGIAAGSIYHALKSGKLSCTGEARKKLINLEDGKKQFYANLDRTASTKKLGKKLKKELKEVKAIKEKKQAEREPNVSPPKIDQDGELTIAEAERREKVYKAQLSELKYLEQAGKVVNVEKIQLRAFELARKTRDAIMSVPARFAHELAAETDPHSLEIMLTKQLQKTLEQLSRKSNE